MTDVFVSYCRRDKNFVQVLHQALQESTYDAWIDWEDIPLTADWWEEIKIGIEAANTFLFVISPDSIKSKVCGQEIDYAVANNKRLVPIVRREDFDTTLMHPALRKYNWLYFRAQDDFDKTFQSLVDVLNADLDHIRVHTRLLTRALEWERKHRRDDLLLRGKDLTEAEDWLKKSLQDQKTPLLTEQHKIYVIKSREVENANQRLIAAGEKAKRMVGFGAMMLGVIISITAGIGVLTIRASRELSEIKLASQLEQESNYVLGKFSSDPLGALAPALQNAAELAQMVSDGRSLVDYPTTMPLVVLKTILDNIQEEKRFKAHESTIWSMDINFKKSLIVTSGEDEKTRIWDFDGNKKHEIENSSESFVRVQFNEAGTLLALIDGYASIELWSVDGNQQIAQIQSPQKDVSNIAFSPDGKSLATAGLDGSIILWNLDDDSQSQLISIEPQKTIEKKFEASIKSDIPIVGLAFSPDGKFIATGGDDGAIRFLSSSGAEISQIKAHQERIWGIDISPDGTLMVTTGTDAVKLWDISSGKQIAELKGHRHWSPRR